MKMIRLLRDSSIFKKIMAAFLAALLPLMAITWMINEQGSNNIRTEISESMLSKTRFYMDSLDKEADRINRYLPNYVMDHDLMEIAATGSEMSSYDRSSKILGIQRRLDLMKNSSPFIQEAKAYIPLIERTILSIQYETDLDRTEYEAMQHHAKSYEEPFIYWNGRLFMTMQYPINTIRNPLYIVGIELSGASIRETLSQIGGERGGQSMLVNLDRGWEVASGNNGTLLEQMRAFAMKKKEAGAVEGYETVVHNGKRFLTVYQYSNFWNSYSVTCIPEETVLGSLQMYRTLFWWACALALGIVLFFTYFLFRLIYRPLMKLVHSFRRVQQNRLDPIVTDRGADEFGYLYQAFNDTITSLKTLIEENYEQQIRNQRSELKRLQSQINPHFLYNCFFVLCRLIKSDSQKEKAYQFCLYIGQYFQFITRNDEDDIALTLEVEHSRTYVEMQTICYGERIEVWFEGGFPDMRVPRLILQPIIENAYKHALGNTTGLGELWVHCETGSGEVSLIVEDNGDGLSDAGLERLRKKLQHAANRLEETTGLLNVHRRIQLRCGEQYGIELARSQLGGLQVRLKLSLNEEERADVQIAGR